MTKAGKVKGMVYKGGFLCVVLLLVMLLSACGGKQQAEMEGKTAKETVSLALGALKELDLETFNACTDNYVSTVRNWMGVPTGKEYRMFNELLQPGVIKGKRYEANYEFAEKLVEHMEWELLDVREGENEAEADVQITNTDLTDLMGYYLIELLGQMAEADGTGIRALMGEMAALKSYDISRLTELMEELEGKGTRTEELTVRMVKEDGVWRLCLDEDLIRALLGNMDSETFSDEVEAKLQEQEVRYEEKVEDWADEFEDRMEEMFQ